MFVFVRFAFWQLSRLEERRAFNKTVEERGSEHERPLAEILGQYGEDIDAMLHRSAIVEGMYRTGEEFFAIGRAIG